MTQVVVTLVFSLVMLLFMAYPAKMLTDALQHSISFSERTYAVTLVTLDIVLSLAVGLFLRLA